MHRIRINSGGQSGADRAALDVAVERDADYSGWCPRGGWAEDMPTPPGLLEKYPRLRETPLRDPAQRTQWNVRDADRTLILLGAADDAVSSGTRLTASCAGMLGKPCLAVNVCLPGAVEGVIAWLCDAPLGDGNGPLVLNIAGPRESEAPGLYRQCRELLTAVFDRIPLAQA